MARRKDVVEVDIKKLITVVGGFEEKEENFELCLQYVTSNLKYHRFLDVDSHKINRTLEGIVQKLTIHSQEEKAGSLQRLVTEFLEAPVFENRDQGKTDTHYGLLSLVFLLAEAPLFHDYLVKTKTAEEEEGDSFDWRSYLLEDIEIYKGPYLESPDLSAHEDEDDEEEEAASTGKKSRTEAAPLREGFSSRAVELSDSKLARPSAQEQEWLERNVMVQYWKGSVDKSCTTCPASSNLHVDWEAYLNKVSPLHVIQNKCTVTEHHIIREIVWLLSGVEDLFLFTWDGHMYRPSEDIYVTHLTQEALMSVLQHYAHYGTVVRRLSRFVEAILGTPQSGHAVCQTYQAFAAALSEHLRGFMAKLVLIEKDVCQQECTMTLAVLTSILGAPLRELDQLHVVYVKGVEPCERLQWNSQRAAHLLGTMYDLLLEHDVAAEDGANKMCLLLPLWLKSCQPYFDIIDYWLAYGCLADPHSEFIMQRNADVEPPAESFWDQAFTLHCAQEVEETMNASRLGMDISDSSTRSHWAPGFLLPVLEQVILAGKSMELLQNLGRHHEVVHNYYSDVARKTLYESFVSSLEDLLGGSTSTPSSSATKVAILNQTRIESDTTVKPTQETFLENIAGQMQVKGVKDPLLQLNFSTIFHPDKLKLCSYLEGEDCNNRKLHSLNLDQPHPVQLLLQTCLYPHIQTQYNQVCCTLLQILKQEYHLVDYFDNIRRFFLMEAGHTMHDFYTELFEKLRLQESWQDASFLNSSLQEAIHSTYPSQVDKLFVSIEESPIDSLTTSTNSNRGTDRLNNRHPVSALEGLTLHYQVPWPINLVLSSKCLHIYNRVFGFLLQVKRVKYSLDELRFSDLEKNEDVDSAVTDCARPARSNLVHRMQVFRVKLMHFVNSVHNYLMTRILHSTGLEFQEEMKDASDLDQVLCIHNSYVSKIHERCFLHKKVAFIKDVVTKALNLALVFTSKWDVGVDSISLKELGEMEAEYGHCIHFLTSFLNNVIKRGSFPHLESLASALISSNEGKKHSDKP